MSTPREDLTFEVQLESNSIFIYYLTGTLALVFLITLSITKQLQRTQPMVTELIHDSNITEELVSFLVKVETSIWPGSGCSSGVKVYMQLIGQNSTSQYFLLQSKGAGKPILKRGFTDIFLIKIPVSLGPVSSVKFILSGLEGPLKWKIRSVELHKPSSNFVLQLPASIIVTERCEASTHHNVDMSRSDRGVVEKLFRYHQWFSQMGNTMRYGSFTAVTHVICVFTTLTTLLDLTLVTYILLPSGQVKDEFELVLESSIICSLCPSFGYCLLLFLIEMVLRNVRSETNSPGNAYYTVCNENTDLNALCYKEEPDNESPFIMNASNFDTGLVWDNDFQSITCFLSSFQHHLKSDLASVFFHTGLVDPYYSATDFMQVYAPTLEVPRYSGIALNHLLNKGLTKKGSSLLGLIQRDSSYHSIQSFMGSQPSSDGIENSQNDLVIIFPSDSKDASLTFSGDRQVDDATVDLTNKCSVDSDIFWQQYKHCRENLKTKRPELQWSGHDFEQSLENETDDRSLVSGLLVELEEENKSKPKKQKLARTGKESRGLGVDDFTTDMLDVIIDFTGVEEENEIRLELLDHERKKKKSSDETVKDKRFRMADNVQFRSKSRYKSDFTSCNWEALLKSRSRKLVADICQFYRHVRIQIMEGVIIEVSPIVEWFDNILGSITMACSLKNTSQMEEIVERTEILNLALYMSGEIIHLTLNEVFKSLVTGHMDLADIVIQSHHIMLAVEEAAYSILYAINNTYLDEDQMELVRRLDTKKYMCYIGSEFFKHSFQLIVNANELTWAYFEIYLLQILRDNINNGIFHNLMQFVKENLKHETEEIVVLQKLCKTAVEEAKFEVWEEYHNETNMFIDMTVKQEILDKLASTRNTILQRQKDFIQEYDLLAKVPKSRIQIMIEKRKKKADGTGKQGDKKHLLRKKVLKKWALWVKETGKMTIPSYKEMIQHSMQLEKMAGNLKLVYDQIERRWTRLGLKKETHGLSCLVQSLVHSHTEGEDPEKFKLNNYLQVKRVESLVQQFIQMILDDLSQYVILSAVDDYNLLEFPSQFQLKLSVEDICIRVDIMKDILLEELDTITVYAVGVEEHKLMMDRNLIESTSHLLMRKSSHLLQWAPTVSSHFMDLPAKPSQGNMPGDRLNTESNVEAGSQDSIAETGDSSPCHKENMDQTDSDQTLVEVSMSDLKNELRLIQLFLKEFTKTEELRGQCTLTGYTERQKQLRSRLTNIMVHNIIDSYYIIEEGDDTKTFTKHGLYQLEYDVMGESKKKLPPYVKTLVVGLLLMLIVSSLVMVTLIGGQFDTTQNQEFLCCYLVSVLVFALVFEPFRALAVANLCGK